MKTLEKPVVVQSIATDGQLFYFMVLQLNTLDLDSSDGIKNLVWMDGDQALYDTVASQPKIRRKVVVVSRIIPCTVDIKGVDTEPTMLGCASKSNLIGCDYCLSSGLQTYTSIFIKV